MANLRKRARQSFVRLIRSPGAPREVAGGLAVGVFVAMVPVMQTAIALGSVEILRRITGIKLSRLAAAAGVWLTNPLTAAPLYGVAYVLGLPLTRLFWKHPIGGASEALEAIPSPELRRPRGAPGGLHPGRRRGRFSASLWRWSATG